MRSFFTSLCHIIVCVTTQSAMHNQHFKMMWLIEAQYLIMTSLIIIMWLFIVLLAKMNPIYFMKSLQFQLITHTLWQHWDAMIFNFYDCELLDVPLFMCYFEVDFYLYKIGNGVVFVDYSLFYQPRSVHYFWFTILTTKGNQNYYIIFSYYGLNSLKAL